MVTKSTSAHKVIATNERHMNDKSAKRMSTKKNVRFKKDRTGLICSNLSVKSDQSVKVVSPKTK